MLKKSLKLFTAHLLIAIFVISAAARTSVNRGEAILVSPTTLAEKQFLVEIRKSDLEGKNSTKLGSISAIKTGPQSAKTKFETASGKKLAIEVWSNDKGKAVKLVGFRNLVTKITEDKDFRTMFKQIAKNRGLEKAFYDAFESEECAGPGCETAKLLCALSLTAFVLAGGALIVCAFIEPCGVIAVTLGVATGAIAVVSLPLSCQSVYDVCRFEQLDTNGDGILSEQVTVTIIDATVVDCSDPLVFCHPDLGPPPPLPVMPDSPEND